MQIIPMIDLKDTTKIEKLCNETKAPIFITKNGYNKLVIMGIECFERLMNEFYEAKNINQGLKDLDENKVIDGKVVSEEIKNKYGF